MMATVIRPHARAHRQPRAAIASTEQTAPRSPNRFVRAREARQTEVTEDYVELIDDLIADTGEARAADIARALGVTQATVTSTIARLVRDGMVTCQPYRSIFLTPRGKTLAKWSRDRHRIVRDFLLAIGVSSDTADADSEGLEHHVSEETLAALKRLTTSLTKDR